MLPHVWLSQVNNAMPYVIRGYLRYMCNPFYGIRIRASYHRYYLYVAGIAGRFPESENVAEFRENLFSKTDMITSLRRWNADELKIPSRIGQINMLEKFDAGFFGTLFQS